MEDKYLGQLLLMGIPGAELDADTARRLKALQPGGFIIFGRNIKTLEKKEYLRLRMQKNGAPFII